MELLVERAAELARLDALLDTISAGTGSALVVEGEGLGKTRLLAEAVDLAHRRAQLLGGTGEALSTDWFVGVAGQA